MSDLTEFIDAQEAHRANPDEFWAPSQEELDSLKAGDLVKICNEHNSEEIFGGERFWVQITKINGSQLFGLVANMLLFSDLEMGQAIVFDKCNIYDYENK